MDPQSQEQPVSPPQAPIVPAAEPPVPVAPDPTTVTQPTPIVTPAPSATPEAATVAAAPEPAQPAVIPGSMKKILLVEDDDALASVYQTRLQAEGFDIRRVPNGEEALASALQYKPDLILLDVMMPKVSGFDVLDILRNTPETTNVKIIMLTALSQDSDRQRAEELGVDDYLVKSQVVIADVVERIKHHLHI
jgi:CheY-like chemotaxis protein